MAKHRIFTMSFASVYPHYIAKAERKGRTKAEVDQIIRWLMGGVQVAGYKSILEMLPLVLGGLIITLWLTRELDILTTGEEIIALLKELSQGRGVTVISATHDFKMLNVSDQVVWIRDGRVDKIENREELSISVGQIGSVE